MLKKKDFLSLKQGAMSVSEYHDKFTQLSQYAPAEVDKDSKKQDLFQEGHNDGLQSQHLSHTFVVFSY
jgi:hypothetical protein